MPRLNVGPTCHPIDRSDKSIQIDTERCLKTENDAREQLVRQWADFPAADRALCTQTATLTDMASYVDLLTCLEMKRDVAKLPADRGLRTAPAALPTPRSPTKHDPETDPVFGDASRSVRRGRAARR